MSAAQVTSYSFTLAVAGLMCLIVGIFVWRTRRQVVGARALTGYLMAMCWWDLTYAIFWTGASGPTPNFWLDITYLGVVAAPTLLFVFTYQITGAQRPLSAPVLAALSVEPLLVLLTLFTDPWHGLFFAGQRVPNSGVILHGGPIFWLNVVYSYALLLIVTIMLTRSALAMSGLYRRQMVVTLLGIGITWINSIVFVAGLNPLPGADNTPFSFSIVAILTAYALIRYRMLDIVPIARSQLLEGMRDGLIVVDTRNRLLDINRTAQQEVDPQRLWRIGDPVNPQKARFPEFVEQFLLSGDGRSEITLNESPPRHVDLQITNLHDAAGAVVGRLIVWREITELWQARRTVEDLNRILEDRIAERTAALATANLHLQEMDRLKDEFIARIGHELRTPLTNIKLYLHLLERATPAQQERYLKTATSEATILHEIIERLLNLPQLTMEVSLTALEPLSIAEIVNTVLMELDGQIATRRAPVTIDLETDLPRVLGNRAALQTALHSLLDNALKYAPDSPVTLTAYIGHTHGQSWVCTEIVDEGPGLDAQDQLHLFERFYRGSAAGTYQIPGIGMGLTIARQLVQAMGGDITVSSVLGEGTHCMVRLKPVQET